MAFVKGKSGNPGGTSKEVLEAFRTIRHLLSSTLKNLTVADIEQIYRDKDGNIIRGNLLEYLKVVLHYWPDGFIDPDVKPTDKPITIRVEVIGSPPKKKADGSEQTLITSTIKVNG